MNSVTTIADLRLEPIPAANNYVIHLASHSVPNDGADGFWMWDKDSLLTDNTGLVVKPDSLLVGQKGRWRRQFDDVHIDPRWFGARADVSLWAPQVGQGVTPGGYDSQPAIQAAIDCAMANNTGQFVIRFPRGVFWIGDTIDWRRGVNIIGSPTTDGTGAATQIYLLANKNCSMLATYAAGFNYSSLEDIVFNGNASAQTAENPCVHMHGAYVGSRIKNVIISNNRGTGLLIGPGSDIVLENIWVGDIYTSGAAAMIVGNPLPDGQHHGGVAATALYVERPYIIGSLLQGKALHLLRCINFNCDVLHIESANVGLEIENCRTVTISGARFVHCGPPPMNNPNNLPSTPNPTFINVITGNSDTCIDIGGCDSSDCLPGNWVIDNGPSQPVTIPTTNTPYFEGYHRTYRLNAGLRRGLGTKDAHLDFGVLGPQPKLLLSNATTRNDYATSNAASLELDPATLNLALKFLNGGTASEAARFRQGSGAVFTGFTGLAADPTTSNLTASQYGVFKNTTSGALHLAANDSGTIKKVRLETPASLALNTAPPPLYSLKWAESATVSGSTVTGGSFVTPWGAQSFAVTGTGWELVDNYVKMPVSGSNIIQNASTLAIGSRGTVLAIVRPDVNDAFYNVLSVGGLGARFNGAGYVAVYLGIDPSPVVSPAGAYSTGQWMVLAVSYTSTSIEVASYWGTSFQTSGPASRTYTPNRTLGLGLGSSGLGASRISVGTTEIYDTALTGEQLEQAVRRLAQKFPSP